jgi:hypothetical protein
MYLLYTDETNIDPTTTEFFVYGGVAFNADHAEALSHGITSLRAKHGYKREDVLKFNTRERPAHVDAEMHRHIKKEVMELAAQHEVKLFASMILHSVATNVDEARRNEINRIAYHYDCFLNRERHVGLVLVDMFTDGQLHNHLREKFTVGLKDMPYSKVMPLHRILGYHLATVGSSHFCSLIDIVLGALRFAINSRKDPSKTAVVGQILSQLSPLCIREANGSVSELCLFFSPKNIRVPQYRAEYQGLSDLFASSGMTPSQAITG